MNSSSSEELPAPLVFASSRLKWGLAGGVALAALAADLFTKRLALAMLLPSERIELLPLLSLQRTSNRGVAFGMLSGRTGLIAAAAGVSLLIVLLYFLLEPRPVFAGTAAGLLIGGSLGNLVERLTRGSVTDFIKLTHWPTFNLADVFIVAGVAVVIASLLLGDRGVPPDEAR